MARALPITHLQALLDRLGADGRTVVGPVARDGAVVLEPVRIVDELAQGWRDEQAPGRYRLVPGEPRVFGALLGPQSPKTWLYPAKLTLFRAERDGASFRTTSPDRPPRLALLGLRACDLAAIRLQDRVLLGSGVEDPAYASRRREVLLVAVQCHRSAETCFCASMDTGPEVSSGYDLRLTEVIDERGHRLVVEAGSEAGRAIAADLPLVDVPHDDDAASRQAAEARAGQSKSLRTEGLRERLLDALRGPHWDEVATRCLGCAGCTMVCPTCFCTAVADVTDATGAAERVRRWDSCFHTEFTHVHGGPTRAELAARYRQWLTHKLATWHDQFGTSGCVGCGRCTTWCPAGIDLVAEAERAATAERRTEVSTEEVRAALAAHPFCQGLPEAALDTLAGHARLQVLAEGLTLFEAGERSHASWLIREGRVGIALHELEVVETVEAGELLGWSWLIGQWQWHADARALTEVHAIRLDGDALAERCRAEPSLGFELARRALRAATGRLERSRLQAHDVFRVRGA